MKCRIIISSVLLVLLMSNIGFSEEKGKDKFNKRMSIDEKLEILAMEIEQLKTGKELFTAVDEQGAYGLGPAGSKVYKQSEGLSIGGYGEIKYLAFEKEDESDNKTGKYNSVDALRAIIYMGYKFNDNIIFNSEIEIEHGHEIYLEFS